MMKDEYDGNDRELNAGDKGNIQSRTVNTFTESTQPYNYKDTKQSLSRPDLDSQKYEGKL